MPIILKSPMPYYDIGEFKNSGTIVLFTQYTIQESDGTNITNVGDYTIPANTLNKNGDIIEFTYWGNSYNSPTNFNIWLQLFGNTISVDTNASNGAYLIRGRIIRATSNTLYYSINYMYADAQQITKQGGYGGINFTTTNLIRLQIQASIDGNIRLTSAYINTLKA